MSAHATVPGRRTVVVVEDDPEIRELETFLLGAEGYRVVALPDGDEVAATVKKTDADLVLLDLMLPGRPGNLVLQDLEQDLDTKKVPVIVVSAYPRQLEATPQVRRVLAKPFDVTDLLDAVAHELESAG